MSGDRSKALALALLLAAAATPGPARAIHSITPPPPVFRLAVIPVEFSDRAHTFTAEQIDARFFSVGTWRTSPGGAPQLGSIREYWSEVSYGKFTLTGRVFPWVLLSRPIDSYDGEENELVAEAKVKAGYDPAQFDGFAIVYAGLQRVRAFPYRVHASPSGRYYVVNEGESLDHLHLSDLAAISNDCHELGHVLGLPDLYWAPSSFGPWDLMALNRACPQHLSAWSKEQLGWLTPRVVLHGSYRGRSLPPLAASPTADKLVSERSAFYVENRQPIGFDACLPASGVVISHLDPTTHTIMLEQADAASPNSYAPEGDVFPGWTGNTHFGCATVPSSQDPAPGACAIEMTHITSPPGGDATYDLDLTWRDVGITVDGAGNYPSLFAAFQAVRPGQTVRVPPGTFSESVTMKPGVALLGAGPDASVLRHPASSGGWIVKGADGVVISGFTLQGGGRGVNGVSVGDGAVVADNVFRDFSGVGSVALVLNGTSLPARIVNNVFDANTIGIYRNGPADIRNNVFLRNAMWTYVNGSWPTTGGCNEHVADAARPLATERAADPLLAPTSPGDCALPPAGRP